MDEYKHCMNCLMSRTEVIKIALSQGLENKEGADKAYNKILQWFKDTYELKRKPQTKKSSN